MSVKVASKNKSSVKKQKEYREPGSRFFIEKLDGMLKPSIGYCSHYPPYEVMVCGIVHSSTMDEKIHVEVIGLIE